MPLGANGKGKGNGGDSTRAAETTKVRGNKSEENEADGLLTVSRAHKAD